MSRPDDLARLIRNAAPQPMSEEDEIDLFGIFRLMRRRRWLMLLVAAVVLVIALPLILTVKPVYIAHSRLLIDNPVTSAFTRSDALEQLNLTTEVERLLSRDMAVRVIDMLEIDALPEFNSDLREPTPIEQIAPFFRQTISPGISALLPALVPAGAPDEPVVQEPLDGVLPNYFQALGVGRDPNSNVIHISFRSEDRELAAAVPATLLQVYLETREASRRSRIARADVWLAARDDEQRERVTRAENAVQRFAEAQGPDHARVSPATVERLNAERSEYSRTRVQLAAKLAILERGGNREGLLATIEDAEAIELARNLQAERNQLELLLLIHAPDSRLARAMRNRIARIEAAIDSAIERHILSLKSEISILGRSHAEVTDELRRAETALMQLAATGGRQQALELALENERAALAEIENQRRALLAQANLPIADIEVLSPAALPQAPINRGRMFYAAVAVIAAGMLALTAAFAVEMMDRSVRSPQQLRGIRGLRPAGMIRRLPARARWSPARFLRRPQTGAFGDAIRSVVMELQASPTGKLPGSMLVTAALPREGKSLLAAAVAFELAARGRPILLVDADMRRGHLHHVLGGGRGPGLAEFAAGHVPIEAVVRDAGNGISFIPRGDRFEAPLREEHVQAIAAVARDQGRMLVIVGAPALATAEATLLARLTEQTLLVVRWGRTSRAAVLAAVERLHHDESRPILVALNMVRPRRHAHYGFHDAAAYSGALRRYAKTP